MKKLYSFLAISFLCFLFIACSATRSRDLDSPTITERIAAVIDIAETNRSKVDLPETSRSTEPKYFEVIARGPLPKTTKVTKKPTVTTKATTATTEATSATVVTTTATTKVTTATTTVTTKVTTTNPPKKEYYTVKFVDMDGYTTISVQSVEKGKNAVAPSVTPKRGNMVFIGWDKDFTNVHANMTVKAIYEKEATTAPSVGPVTTAKPKEYFTVKFVDIDGYTAISVQSVEKGTAAFSPPMPDRRGELLFRGWDKDFSNVRSNMTVKAIYQKERLTVRFHDADGTLLKTQQVLYGETASPPHVPDKGNYLFDGWNTVFSNVTEDLNVYATYYIVPTKKSTPLTSVYKLLNVKQNSLNLPQSAYYRKTYTGVFMVGRTEHTGSVLYGNFCDEFPIAEYDFTEFSGILALKKDAGNDGHIYALRLTVYLDGKQVYSYKISGAGANKSFSINLAGAKTMAIHLEPTIDNAIYYENVSFIGGLVDAVLYEE